MINVIGSSDCKEESVSNGGFQITFPYDLVNIKIVKYPKGSEIPRHKHDVDTFHYVLKGKIKNSEGNEVLSSGAKYKCGGIQYGPWLVLEDVEMMVIGPK